MEIENHSNEPVALVVDHVPRESDAVLDHSSNVNLEHVVSIQEIDESSQNDKAGTNEANLETTELLESHVQESQGPLEVITVDQCAQETREAPEQDVVIEQVESLLTEQEPATDNRKIEPEDEIEEVKIAKAKKSSPVKRDASSRFKSQLEQRQKRIQWQLDNPPVVKKRKERKAKVSSTDKSTVKLGKRSIKKAELENAALLETEEKQVSKDKRVKTSIVKKEKKTEGKQESESKVARSKSKTKLAKADKKIKVEAKKKSEKEIKESEREPRSVSKPTKKRSEAPTIKTSKTLKINKSK
jgi:hypothetical protein